MSKEPQIFEAWDADGHVEEWAETFSDKYLDPPFRDRRPEVVDPNGDGRYLWKIADRPSLFKVGGSPTSMNGVASPEQALLAEWRGSLPSAEFHSAADRLALMDQETTLLQVNYPTMLLGWPISYNQPLNAAITRAYNNWVADVSNQAPDRMKWVSVVDPGDPEGAALEIIRTKEMGSVGVMVFGVYGDKSIDDPSFEPIWATAAETGMSVAVHPGIPSLEINESHPNFGQHQFKFSVLMGFKRIMLSGILDRYPDLKVGFLETGCAWVDFMVELTQESLDMATQREEAGLKHRPFSASFINAKPELGVADYIRRGQVFFGFEVDEDILSYMVDKYGPDCWLYASDIPHAHRRLNSPVRLQERTDLSEEAKRQLLVDNTASFYGLPLP